MCTYHPKDEQQEKGAEEENLERVVEKDEELNAGRRRPFANPRRHKEKGAAAEQRKGQHNVEEALAIVAKTRLPAHHEKTEKTEQREKEDGERGRPEDKVEHISHIHIGGTRVGERVVDRGRNKRRDARRVGRNKERRQKHEIHARDARRVASASLKAPRGVEPLLLSFLKKQWKVWAEARELGLVVFPSS